MVSTLLVSSNPSPVHLKHLTHHHLLFTHLRAAEDPTADTLCTLKLASADSETTPCRQLCEEDVREGGGDDDGGRGGGYGGERGMVWVVVAAEAGGVAFVTQGGGS